MKQPLTQEQLLELWSIFAQITTLPKHHKCGISLDNLGGGLAFDGMGEMLEVWINDGRHVENIMWNTPSEGLRLLQLYLDTHS